MRASLVILFIGLLLVLSGCIQPPEEPKVSEKVASEEWKAEGIIGENEYARSVVLVGPARQGYSGGEMEISWNNDQEYLYMALRSKTSGWLSIGFEPSEWMKDADIIMGMVEDGKPVVLDEYSTGNYGPHQDDTTLGGSYDILESGGREVDGYTVLEFKRKLNTGDRFDKALAPGQSVSIIWALADSKSHDLKHNIAYGEGILALIQEQKTEVMAATLSPRDKEGVLFIWEEEKVARDLYIALFQETNMSVFTDLARSEQNHMDQAKVLIDKYHLQMPVSDAPGVFSNQTLTGYYNDLLARGSGSPQDALESAATFEEISIVDLEKEIAAVSNEDVIVVFQGLLAGSRKHLRSYVKDLQELGIEYTPQYLSQREFDDITKS